MEQFASVSNWLTILPPIILIILAVITRDVIFSITFGICVSALIFTRFDIIAAFFHSTETATEVLTSSYNVRVIAFLLIISGVVGLISKSGSAKAFSNAVGKFVKTKRRSLLITYILGFIIFTDSYFNALTIGTVMRPLTDKNNVARAKLAYVINSTGGPVCVLVPLSSFIVYAMSQINLSPGFSELNMSSLSVFLHSIPYNFYALLSLSLVLAIIICGKDFGLMKYSQKRADITGGKKLYWTKFGEPLGTDYKKLEFSKRKVYLIDMFLPILILIITAFSLFPIVGYMEIMEAQGITTFTQSISMYSIGEAFDKTDSSKVLFYSSIITATSTYCYYLLRKLIIFKDASTAFLDGTKTALTACVVLILAWIFSAMMKTDVQTGAYVSNLITEMNFPIALLPPVLFLFCAIIAFCTGSSFATFAIMIPLTVKITIDLSTQASMDPALFLHISIASILGGGVWGNQSTPVADTTIIAATASNMPHLEHVISQLYYTGLVVIHAFIGSLVITIFPHPFILLPILIASEVTIYLFISKYGDLLKQNKLLKNMLKYQSKL